MKGLSKFFNTTFGGGVIAAVLLLTAISILILLISTVETNPSNTLNYEQSEIEFNTLHESWFREDEFTIYTDTYIVIDDFVVEFAMSEFSQIEYVVVIDGEFIDMEEDFILNKDQMYEITIISVFNTKLAAEYKAIEYFELKTDMDLYIKWFVEEE